MRQSKGVALAHRGRSTACLPPVLRVGGKLLQAPYETFTDEHTQRMLYAILAPEQKRRFEAELELDLTHNVPGRGVFQGQVFRAGGAVSAVFSANAAQIKTLAELDFPPTMERLADVGHGLILFAGPSGSGRTTAIAAMIDHINRTRSANIITIEDPIVYDHSHKMSVIRQREIGSDAQSFAGAIRAAYREDPDVLYVSLPRDLETMEELLAFVDGNRVAYARIATTSAVTTVERFIESFAEDKRGRVRLQLSNNLVAVIALQRVPKADGTSWCQALEIMVATPQIRQMIREDRTSEIRAVIESSANIGMQTMDQSLRDLYLSGVITREIALRRAMNRLDLEAMLPKES